MMTSRFADLHVLGRLDLADIGSFVAGANHRSLADLVVGMAAFHRLGVQPSILFKKSFLPGPLAKIARKAGVIVVEGRGATETAAKALQSGASIMVMIEGGLYYNPNEPAELGPVKAGIARIARSAERPMVPISVDGTEFVWPKGRWPRWKSLIDRPVITVRVGDPTMVEGPDDEQEAVRLGEVISAQLALPAPS